MTATPASITSHIQYFNHDEINFMVMPGDTDFFDTEATVAILDSLPVEIVEEYQDTSTEDGDAFFYQAESVGLANNVSGGTFEVHIPAFKNAATLSAYLTDRAARGVPVDGDSTDLNRQSTLAKIEKLNAAIKELHDDPNLVLWFSNDGSWGGARDLNFRLASDLTPEEREQWEMD